MYLLYTFLMSICYSAYNETAMTLLIRYLKINENKHQMMSSSMLMVNINKRNILIIYNNEYNQILLIIK